MPEPDRPTCHTCPFFRKIPRDDLGHCHRHAPRPGHFPADDPERPDLYDDMFGWPLVAASDFCGEHPDMHNWVAAGRRPPPPASDEPIEVLGLSVRPWNALIKGGIRTIGELLSIKPTELDWMHNIGPVGRSEILRAVAEHGLEFRTRR